LKTIVSAHAEIKWRLMRQSKWLASEREIWKVRRTMCTEWLFCDAKDCVRRAAINMNVAPSLPMDAEVVEVEGQEAQSQG
jgi:hypothetical protein